MNWVGRYLLNWARWFDEGLNVATGGDANETLSSRAGKAQKNNRAWACILCRFLDIFQRDHCAKSINHDDGANATIPDGE
jgi:hypothetical protein